MRGFSACFALLLWCLPASSQEAPCRFEVAAVKRSPELSYTRREETDTAIRYRSYPALWLIANAYGLESYQVKGPSRLFDERYDIDARLPQGATKQQIPACMQALLNERFHLRTHKEPIETPVYVLKMMPGGIRAASVPEESMDPKRASASFHPNNGRVIVDGPMTLKAFTSFLTSMMQRPVLNRTGDNGAYHFRLDAYTGSGDGAEAQRMRRPDGSEAPPEGTGSIFTAVKALGLSLTPAKEPLEQLVVDGFDREPTAN